MLVINFFSFFFLYLSSINGFNSLFMSCIDIYIFFTPVKRLIDHSIIFVTNEYENYYYV